MNESPSIERNNKPTNDLDRIAKRVNETMESVYKNTPLQEVPQGAQEEMVKRAVDEHIEERLAKKPLGNPFGSKYERTKNTQRLQELGLKLSPDEDDAYIQELLEMVQEIGIVATIKAIDESTNYHIKDDLHRALVAYLHTGRTFEDFSKKNPLHRGLSMTLFELALPIGSEEERKTELKQLLSSMEQFYAGMRGVLEAHKHAHYLSIEVALAQKREEVVIYAAVPNEAIHVFRNQLLAIFPDIRLTEATDDYNIFNKKEAIAVSVLKQVNSPLLPIKTYQDFDYDPLNILLEAFAHLDYEEGAAVQIIFGSGGVDITEEAQSAIEALEAGEDPARALKFGSSLLWKGLKQGFGDIFKSTNIEKQEKEEAKRKERAGQSDRRELVELVQKKRNSRSYACNVRLVAAGNSDAQAERILEGFESVFYQFSLPQSNEFGFTRMHGRALNRSVREFTYRIFNPKEIVYLNTAELSTIIHFHKKDEGSSDILASSSATTAGASTKAAASSRGQEFLLHKGKVLLGNNIHQGSSTPIYLDAEDRMRHLYVIGQTGTGKTSIMKNMIIQDIHNGEGCCFIDPHGSDIEDILGTIPQHRWDDVIYFDPSDTDRPMGLNMLEYDESHPEQKSFVVNEMFAIFDKLFDMKVGGGAMFEQYFRNATQLAIDDPATGSTLLEISRVLSDADFRRLKLARTNNVIVRQFWERIATQAGGEASLENIVPYITSKFDSFVGDDIMRPIVAQQHSSFNFREAMDNRKIILVNLSKGRLGEKNANLLGLVIVGKILMAALSRVDAPKDKRPPFYLYIDEFQNVTTDSISQILSEARKYGLSLNVAHQYIKQLEEGIRDSVFGNVGNMVTFRVSSEDAEFLAKVHEPVFTAHDIANIDNYNAYVKMLVGGQPQRSFSIATLIPEEGDPAVRDQIKELSREKYGRPRQEVEAEIMRKYQTMGS
ncbi:MAG: type IV secretory system conjugative DNA transfer family protein [Patescibacteria group bacterium]